MAIFGVPLYLPTIAGNAAGPQLPPAPYKPLPVGTVLDYGSWKCTVTSSQGIETVCGDNNNRLRLMGHFMAIGRLPGNGYGGRVPELYCPSGSDPANENIKIAQADINQQALSQLATIWPLAPGKTAQFSLRLNPGSIDDHVDPINYSLRVIGTTMLSIAGRRLSVWEIAGKTGVLNCGTRSGVTDGYGERWWYSPELGAIVQYEYKTLWARGSYQLKSIDMPGGMPIATVSQALKSPKFPDAANAPPKPDRPTHVEPVRKNPPQPQPMAIDRVAPSIDVPPALKTSSVVVRLQGMVIDQSRVIEVAVNGIPVPLDSTGAFQLNRGVPIGTSRITVAATDEWGNRAEKQVIVTRTARSTTKSQASKQQEPSPQSTTTPRKANPFSEVHFGTYHALIIGNNRYRHLKKLRTAESDARSVASLLRADYGFRVTRLIDATRGDILEALANMRARLKADDNLLIYYAGHGVVDDITEQGYWLPVDAEDRVPTNWISNTDLTNMLRGMSARHVMVLADSCYSGTLVRAASARIATAGDKVAWVKRWRSRAIPSSIALARWLSRHPPSTPPPTSLSAPPSSRTA